MKKTILIIVLGGTSLIGLQSQNSFNAIKTSTRGGIMTTLVNPADLAGMPQKFDINLIGLDINVSNNSVNLTSSELGKTDDFEDRFFNSVGSNGLDLRVNADIIGPSIAVAINKKTSIGLITRGRVFVAANNVDVALAKSIIDGTAVDGLTLPYNSPNINHMSANAYGWAELGLTGSREIYRDGGHSLKIGGTFKALFSGAYANTYLDNLKFRLFQDANNNLLIDNAVGNIGLEYTGSSDPLKDISNNMIGAPSGIAFDAGISYQLLSKDKKDYILKLGASLLDIGSMRYNLEKNSSRKFTINPGTHDPSLIGGDDLDEIINNIKSTNLASEIPTDSSINVAMPMSYNFQADVHVWKPLYVTMNLNRSATHAESPRSMQALNYLTITPRLASRFVEIYMPFTFADIQGTTIGAGLKLGPLYLGSSSIVSALASNENKAVDFHFGLRAGFGKRFK